MSTDVSLTFADGADPSRPQLLPLRNLLAAAQEDAIKRNTARAENKPLGPVTGLAELDLLLGGFLTTGVHIVHGGAGTGKTALCGQIAASCGCPCLYVTLEMTPLVLLKRHACRVTKEFLGRFSTGEFLPEKAAALYLSTAEAIPHLALLDGTTVPVDLSHISEAMIDTRQLDPGNPHLLVIVDSLHSWAEQFDGAATEYDRLNAALAALRTLSAQYDCTLLAIAERNRASMKKGGLSAGAGTRKIEYGAETVLDLEAEEAHEDARGERPVEITLAKNRNGTLRATSTLFHPATMTFRSAAKR